MVERNDRELLRASSNAGEGWASWRYHIEFSISTLEQLREWIDVTPSEEDAIRTCEGKYRWRITPYYASLMDRSDENCPIRKQAVPSTLEFKECLGSHVDPVGDIDNRKTARIIHKYPDRVAMLVSDRCPVYCRHCTRKYHTMDFSGTYYENNKYGGFERDIAYLHSHSEVRDVLLTGGDPLILSDSAIDRILTAIRRIKHIEIIRIGSRCPVVLPQRVTPELCAVLERYHPLFFVTQFNHPSEITSWAAEACEMLLKHGIPVLNQSVLLKGINDSLITMKTLVTRLVSIRVLPYYLYHCDNAVGVSHFVTNIQEGRAIIDGLVGYTTGFAVPKYVVTTKLGKIPLSRDYTSCNAASLTLTNYEGKEITIQAPDHD